MGLPLIALLSFLALTLACGALMLFVRDATVGAPPETAARQEAESSEHTSRTERAAGPAKRTEFSEKKADDAFGRLVLETGLDCSPVAAMLLLVVCGLAVGGSLFVWYEDLLPGLVGLLVGMLAAMGFLLYRRSRRLRTMHEQLPDVLDLMARAVRAGKSLEQAINLVGTEMAEPLAAEFRRCSSQLDMGLSMSAAMRSLSRRIRLTETRIMATTLTVHRQTGGNLTVTLERLAEVIRQRLSSRRRFRAAMAGGRFATILIASIGPLAFLYLVKWQPEYTKNFFEQPLGWGLLGTVVFLQAVGLIWIAGILRNEN